MIKEELEDVGRTTLLERRVDEDKTSGSEGARRHVAGAHGRPARQEEGDRHSPGGSRKPSSKL